MKNIILLLLTFSSLISCVSQKKYSDVTLKEACVILWRKTQKPWVGGYKDVIELINRKAVVDFVHPYETIKTTPFLNASGALECLRYKDRRRTGELDSMEQEAVKIVKYLAKKGANVHAVDISKRNGLHLAAQGGREKMIPVLVDLGLDINAKDSTFWKSTPLILAITAGDLSTVKALVERGADINQCSAYGNTPLDWAIIRSKTKSPKSYPYQDEKEITWNILTHFLSSLSVHL